MVDDPPLREKLHAVYLIAAYRPKFTAGIIIFGIFTALFEGIGATFIIPLVEVAQSPGSEPESAIGRAFATLYGLLGAELTLATIVIGLSLVLIVRYSATFLGEWARINLRTNYVADLQSRSFENALTARIAFFDAEGTDDILNAIVTQASKAGYAIEAFVHVFHKGLLIVMYLSVALYLAPVLTIATAAAIGFLTYLLRNTVESAYTVGDRVADANEEIQRTVQAGTQGIREVKTLRYEDSLLSDFRDGIKKFVDSTIWVNRNEAFIGNAQNLLISIIVFLLIYISFTFMDMSIGELGAFLFVIFRLGPLVSTTNQRYYQLEGMLPHLVRTEEFIDELEENPDIESGDRSVPSDPSPIVFDDVSFSYGEDEQVLSDISFEIGDGDFIALVGESGAGKSTVASLLARFYTPDSGKIYAARTPIGDYDLKEWRSRIAYVRQNPFIFNTTLKRNLLMAKPNASRDEIERVCEIAQVSEFLDDLPDGYETELGDDGVRLSGGQRQRVALARALLEDADILLLDEATSDLDTNIEHRVQSEIESMDRDYIIVAIAHRLSSIKRADRIFTLQDGEIIERGKHDTLIDQGGKYAQLYRSQGQV